ncbi:MAG: hypothetical protein LBP80_10595 [Treponema sp.]|nr:hypothetical protein [Treponema sp.]
MKQRFIPSFCAFVRLSGTNFFNVLANSNFWKVNADALPSVNLTVFPEYGIIYLAHTMVDVAQR